LEQYRLPRKTKVERKKYLSSKTLSFFFGSFRPNTSRSTRPLSQTEQAAVRAVPPARMAVAEKNERERKKIPKRQYSFVHSFVLFGQTQPAAPGLFPSVSKRQFDLCRLLEWLLPRKTKENEKKYLSSKTLSSFFRSFRPNTARSTRPLSQREQAAVRSVSPARMAVAEKTERERKKYLSSKTLSSFFRSFWPNASRSTRPLSQPEQAAVRSVSPARMTVAEKNERERKKYLSNKTLSFFFRFFRPNTARSTRPLSQREQAVVQYVSPARMAVAEKNERERKKYLSSKTLSSFFRSFWPNTSRSTRPLSQPEQAAVRSVPTARMTVAEKNERERKKIPKQQNSFVFFSFFSAKHIPQHPASFSA
jgi:hypothetical protein